MHPQPTPASPPRPVSGLLRTHWVLATCSTCGHEQPRAERCHARCPGCGAPLRTFRIYRELQAER
jgi:predicted RNA-binding Zn-ribbon protein involved in translation (DUF1610 family)